jgi:four helix bundle protein
MAKFDLEDRTVRFAQNVRRNSRKLLDSPISSGDVRQLLRSSGSVGANYIEANEAVSKRDFLHRLKIAQKRG